MFSVSSVGNFLKSTNSSSPEYQSVPAIHRTSVFQWLALPSRIAVYGQATENPLNRVRNQELAREKREQEFELGRHCAYSAMRELGLEGAIARNQDRSPEWPSGVAGSISHSSKFTWSVVGSRDEVQSIGIDTEPIVDPMILETIKNQIVSPDEWIAAKRNSFEMSEPELFTLLFSAKEAFYKCVYPIHKRYLDFRDVHATLVSEREVCIEWRPDDSCISSDRSNEVGKRLSIYIDRCKGSVFALTWIDAKELEWT